MRCLGYNYKIRSLKIKDEINFTKNHNCISFLKRGHLISYAKFTGHDDLKIATMSFKSDLATHLRRYIIIKNSKAPHGPLENGRPCNRFMPVLL